MSNFKKMVEERMAKTGESWSTAAAHVPAQVAPEKAATPAAAPGPYEKSARAYHELDCPLNDEPEGPGVECECVGIDFSLPLLDGDDVYD